MTTVETVKDRIARIKNDKALGKLYVSLVNDNPNYNSEEYKGMYGVFTSNECIVYFKTKQQAEEWIEYL